MNLRLSALVVALLAVAGCEDTRPEPVVATHEGPTPTEQDRATVDTLVGRLAQGRDPSDAKAAKVYDDTVRELMDRGSAIEPQLIDHLRRSEDWAIRLGLIEVLQATGSKACIEHLIMVLDDAHPLVAHRANATLEELCQHREIPKKPTTGPVPPVPPAEGLALDAEEKAWASWHAAHKAALKAAWAAWWDANRDRTTIK